MPAKTRIAEAAFDRMVAQAEGDARKLAALSVLALTNGPAERAYPLAREARALAPGDADIRSQTEGPLSSGVPQWQFLLLRDEARNAAYRAAIERAVGPETRVLDIGAGTGLLAMMAARAGAGAVVTCEMNPAVADAAVDIIALNGYADRVRLVPKRSTELDVETDMGGQADLLVSEIVSNNLLQEGVLPVMEDAVARLLKPGGRMIPQSGRVRIALAHWEALDERRLGEVEGFDMTPFNRLDSNPRKLKVGQAGLVLRSQPADLFEFDFISGGPYSGGRTSLDLIAEGGPVNGVAQWIHLQLDAEGGHENRPGPGGKSSWALLFHALEREIAPAAGDAVPVHGAHTRGDVRIWMESGGA
jgi:type II protein arginine methyltransferase